MEKSLSRLHGILTPFLAWIAFAVIFFTLTKVLPPETGSITSYSILEVFNKYASFAGIAFGFIAFIEILILMGLAALFRLRSYRATMPVIVTLEFSAWAYFGYYLFYVEPRYANLAKAVILFLGEPIMYTGAILAGMGVLWLIYELFRRQNS